ncbi:MAG: hypothetical protein R2697_02765 [Ilumatobacteraceae bacterium]
MWSVDVEYDWQEAGPGTYGSWLTAPLPDDVAVVGSGSVDLYLQSNLGDTDVEVRGRGPTRRAGDVRAERLAARRRIGCSTKRRRPNSDRSPRIPDRRCAPLPDESTPSCGSRSCRSPTCSCEGSRIRLIGAPGGNRAVWAFDTIAQGEQVTIGRDDVTPSRLVSRSSTASMPLTPRRHAARSR